MITAQKALAVAGALAFLFVQIVILEIREASQERRELYERLSAAEARMASLEARGNALRARYEMLAQYVLNQVSGAQEPAEPSSDWRPGPGY